jgi:cytochrome c peroxidase
MHDGSLATLDEVVRFYDEGGRANPDRDPELRPLQLSSEDKRALTEFLRSLSGSVHDGPS